MKTETILTLAAIGAVVAFIVYKQKKSLTPEQGVQLFEHANIPVDKSEAFDNRYNIRAGDTTYYFNDEDFSKLNFSQRTLITLDKIIPGSFLTKWVLS